MRKDINKTKSNAALNTKLYEASNTRKDSRLNNGVPTRLAGILSNSVSPFILRSKILANFVFYIDRSLGNILKAPAYLKNFKNYTTKKDDINVR